MQHSVVGGEQAFYMDGFQLAILLCRKWTRNMLQQLLQTQEIRPVCRLMPQTPTCEQHGWACCITYHACAVPWLQDEQSIVQMATQGCGFVTIISGTFLLHTTKDLDLTSLHMEEMVRQPSLAAASGTTLGSSSVRERRGGMQGSSIELGKTGPGGLEIITVAANVGDKVSGSGADDEQHPLLVSGANGTSNGTAALGPRKGRTSGVFGW